MDKNPLYYAKILLFGEYGIINDAKGLSIPYNVYRGAFQPLTKADNTQKAEKSNASLKSFLEHLKNLNESGELVFELNVEQFEADIEKGFFFDSSIPEGYGVGSSGALCAAIYDRYGINKINPEENIDKDSIVKLKAIFGQMESYFHGKSSGLDPLICYLKLPILIQSKTDLGTVTIPEPGTGEGAIFLLNSGQPGETQPMVNIFMEKMKSKGFRKVMKEEFNKYNDACVAAFLKGDTKPLFSNIKKLSHLALEYFLPMIPVSFHDLWKKGIETNAYYLKLCGSGGGGYILGFTPDYAKAQSMLKEYKPEVIYRM